MKIDISDEELEQFIKTQIIPGVKACIEFFSKSDVQEDIDFAEELKQII
jgi:hypothetical protein